MSDTLSCPNCGRRIKVPPGQEGRKARCPLCRQVFEVPAAEMVDVPSLDDPLDVQSLDPEFSSAAAQARLRSERSPASGIDPDVRRRFFGSILPLLVFISAGIWLFMFSPKLGQPAINVAIIAFLTGCFGVFVNFSSHPAAAWMERNLGNGVLLIACGNSVLNMIRAANQPDIGLEGVPLFVAVVLFPGCILLLIGGLFWWLYHRYGYFRVAATQLLLLTTLGLAVVPQLQTPVPPLAEVDVLENGTGVENGRRSPANNEPGSWGDDSPARDAQPRTLQPRQRPRESSPPDARLRTRPSRQTPPTPAAGSEDVADADVGGGAVDAAPPLEGPERMMYVIRTGDHFERERAIRALHAVDPDDVTSETKKEIARTYRDLVFDERMPDDKRRAIRGLVKWSGKYSVPILLDLLAEDPPFIKDELFRQLGKLQDPRAAKPVARYLGDFHDGQAAYQALRAMGPAAEAGLIEVAPSRDPEVSGAAVELLAEHGTEACVPTLKLAAKSRNRQIRDLAKQGLRRIRQGN